MILKVFEVVGKIILTGIIVVILLLVGTVFLSLVAAMYTGKEIEYLFVLPLFERVLLVFPVLATIVAVGMMYSLFDRKRGLDLGWRQPNRLGAFLEGSFLGICFITASFLVIWLFRGINVTDIGFEREVWHGLLFAVVLFGLVAVSEELLCRGYWYGLIHRYFGAAAAIPATSVLFAMLHLSNANVLQSPIPLINLLLAGIMFGVAREVTSGLWVPIGIHFTWNLFQGNIFGFAVSGLPLEHSVFSIETVGHHLISGSEFGAEGSLLTGILMIIFTVILVQRYKMRNQI